MQSINNNEFKKIIKMVKNEPIFFDNDDKRLQSRDEIINYKEELHINIDIIPLIDVGDNDFIIYNEFQMCNVSNEMIYKDIESIEKYIKLLEDKFEK